MVSIVTKKIRGGAYLYLVHSLRKGKRVIQKTIKYVGPTRPIPREEFHCMERSYRNEDWVLPARQDQLPYTHHQEMKLASQRYLQYWRTLDKVSQEKEREKFLSNFIASSNAIEGSTMTVKDTFHFLFQDIIPSGHSKKELHMAENLLEAWQYLEKNAHHFPSEKELCLLHALVNRHIESEETLGAYKKVQNYIGDAHTTSYLFVEEKMQQLFHWLKKAFVKIDDFEVAFQSHAQFEIIHPFVDGNGRVGRLLLNWLLRWKKHAPLAIRSSRREQYHIALENARRGNLLAICQFCYEEYLQQYQFITEEAD